MADHDCGYDMELVHQISSFLSKYKISSAMMKLL